jgi:4-hydroxy-tetrahydrodipicolinate synthase
MVSPFHADGHADTAAVGRLVERLVSAGVHGVFALGTTGESASIATPDKREIVRATVEAVHDRVPIYAGISGNCLADSLEAAKVYRDLGVAAFVAHAPYFFPVPDDFLISYFQKLADSVPLPLIIYNIPPTTHLSIPLSTVERLSHHPNIIGIKDSQSDIHRFEQVINTVKHRPDFRVLIGSSALSSQSLKLGAHGLVPSTGNFAPAPYVALYKAAMAGRWDDVAVLQKEVDELSAQYQKGRTLGESLAVLKSILARQGVCSPTVLPPLRTLAERA